LAAPPPNDADALLDAAPLPPPADGRAIFFLGSVEAGLAAALEDGLVLGAGADAAAPLDAGAGAEEESTAGVASSADMVRR
jgi:hypothetical protein